MKLSTLLVLPATLLSAVFAAASASPGEYTEHLHLKPLPGGYLYAGFNFTATTSLSDYNSQHFRYFPRSLGQILQHSHTAELHLRFALGRWDEESWGSRPRDGRREGGTGVELWAWVEGGGDAIVVEERWSSLVNSLSGFFCASLNFIDGTKTTRPVLSFAPEGTHKQREGKYELLHGTLPHEVVCTENLTPFLKMLPCKGKAGISSLLDGHKVFDASWQTMGIDVRPVCHNKRQSVPAVATEDGSYEDCDLEIQQTVDMVLDIERSMRPRDDPIPRPPPIEEIVCDETKAYNGPDTCYPRSREGDMAWTLSKIFGQAAKSSCHLDGREEGHDVSLEVPSERTVEVISAGSVRQALSEHQDMRLYTLADTADFDLTLPQQDIAQPTQLDEPSLYASRQMTGYGQERGGMHTTLRNPHPYPHHVVYLESLPWFLRPYVHTLEVQGATLDKMYYTPAIDRQRGTHLELVLTIPAESTVELTYDFEKAILRYTEYPPDANRGFDVAPAVIRLLPSNVTQDQQGSYLRTTSLLLPLPTPDFSMPYNVIILTSTVIALGFGSIFNLLVRRFVLVDEVPPSPMLLRAREVVGRAREVIKEKMKGMKDSRSGKGDAERHRNVGDDVSKQQNGGPGQGRKDE